MYKKLHWIKLIRVYKLQKFIYMCCNNNNTFYSVLRTSTGITSHGTYSMYIYCTV